MTTTATLADRQRLMRERQTPVQLPEQPGVIVSERHYMPKELAAVWRLDETTIRRLFIDEPGVLKIGKSGRRDGKRDYLSLRIPESVAQRVHGERSK